MWWLITVAAIAILLVVVRWGGSDVRFIGRSIGVALNIKPHLIEQMALKMGQERSSMLAKGNPEEDFPNLVKYADPVA
ncbi:hypothetical protein [Pseudomonas sp. CP-1]|uniref:hypothetical protein n=1 Tax=Pseudomonas sp. CP-1 TaxID=2902622 RepID=UPI001E5EF005|nr:hypothetical protein [Pseudomonas sp. CP-1]MCD9092173.1 hypothetical protein [Pseudomonas sp. CP-1]